MKRNTFLAAALLTLAACTGNPSGTSSSAQDSTSAVSDSIPEEVIEAWMVSGFVGTGTTMNTIELVSAEASDTLWLELDDETVRDATLEVGREIAAVVYDGPDGSLHALATMDADEGQ